MLRFFKLVERSCQRSTTIEDTDCFPMLVLVHGLSKFLLVAYLVLHKEGTQVNR